ncbi:ParA family protein [Aestuariibius insulae]|uniref:ParA family protein n=1 Tax=Aestuariibius insulae TaxID=2058287 RepID=UPI00345E8D44
MSDLAGQPEPRIISVANQKGGVGKTTTAVNLAAALAEKGYRILLLDLDPQGNASTGLGIGPDRRKDTTYDVLSRDVSITKGMQPTNVENLWIIPSTTDLSSADIDFMDRKDRIFLLRSALSFDEAWKEAIDLVLIDCPPSLNLLTLNAMVASNSLLVPLQSEFFALEGLSQLMLTVREIRSSANPDLRIEGVVMTMFDGRNRLAQQVDFDARDTLGDLVFKTVIPRNVRLSEAPSFSMSVLQYDGQSRGAQSYRALAAELIGRRDAAQNPIQEGVA